MTNKILELTTFLDKYNVKYTVEKDTVFVSGGLYLSYNNLTSLPDSIGNLKVGGDLYLTGNKLTSPLPIIKRLSKDIIESDWCYVDGILREVINNKTIDGLTIIKTPFDYIVGKNNIWSHGKTIKEAQEDLEFKYLKQNTGELKNLDLDEEITLTQAVNIYRAITGACRLGCENFIKQNNIPDKLTLREGISLLNNAYGSYKFKEFFNID